MRHSTPLLIGMLEVYLGGGVEGGTRLVHVESSAKSTSEVTESSVPIKLMSQPVYVIKRYRKEFKDWMLEVCILDFLSMSYVPCYEYKTSGVGPKT